MTNSNFTEEEAQWIYKHLMLENPNFNNQIKRLRTADIHWLNSDVAVMPMIRGLERMDIDIKWDGSDLLLIGEGFQMLSGRNSDIAAALRLAVKELVKVKRNDKR